ncbi:MAG: NAD-dependent succinate-semialdehyde dehydrogenase [Bacteroidota bacterium]
MLQFQSINPYTSQVIATHQGLGLDEIEAALEKASHQFKNWRLTSFSDRAKLMLNAAERLKANVEKYAAMITAEMGKPISEARGEVNKCAWVCEYYAEHAEEFLKSEQIDTDAQLSLVRNDPMGCVLAIMPWNFPFWQVFRFAVPTLMAGNVAVLKHAPNVFGSAKLIEELFLDADFPEGVFQNLIFHHDQTEQVIAHKAIVGVSLTGSGKAGSAVASLAGKYIKKSLLELGGSNAFIVWEDADLEKAVKTAVNARMMNTGQSCIAAKRFILVESIYDEFVERFTKAVSELKSGDPTDNQTQIGVLARLDLADQLQSQVQRSIDQGADLIYGGDQDQCYHQPTILASVEPGMPAFEEETFGPLAAMIKVKDIDEAFERCGQSKYGLGVTVCTKDTDKALSMADRVGDGAYFVNELVKSDPRLPFGGTKYSGYGRELAKDGILEFVNRKTVYLKS